jgi:hypothetical protein
MSTVRIQIRRGESTDWESIDPVLADGEMGIEIDTNKVKVGNNGANWTDLPYLNVVPTDLDNTLGDYVLVSDIGNAGGPAKLDVDGNLLVPKSSIILEGSSADAYETTLTVTNPTEDRTITLPNATGTVALTSDLNAYATTEALNSVVSSLNIHQAVELTTTSPLSATYANGTADNANGTGIGATLTMNSTGVVEIDGFEIEAGSRILVKDQANLLHNGIYDVTTAGAIGVAAVLTRSTDYDNSLEKTPADVSQGDVIYVIAGETNALKQFSQIYEGTNTDGSVKIGIDNIDFTQVSGTATIIAGAGIIKNGDEISVDSSAFLSTINASSTYLTQSDASNTYLTQSDAQNDYLTQSDASSTYLTQTNASNTYLTTTTAQSTYFAKDTTAITNSNIATGASIAANKISGNSVTQADTGTVTNTMLAGSIANNKLANSTISGKSLGSNLDALTIGTGLSGTSYNGSSPATIAIDSTVATKTYVDDADALKADKSSPTFTGTVTIPTLSVTTTATGITKSMVGLGNVDNTTDADKPVSTATQTALNAKLDIAGGTMTGLLTLSGAPTSDLHAATKLYVDGLAAGINFHQPVVAATAGNLAGTYNNGTNGFGATLTKASNGSIGIIDGATVAVGNRILLRAQTDAKQNGIYVITALGDGSNPWVITRAADNDNNPAGELSNGDFCFVTSGSTNVSKGFLVSTTGTITIGTTEINYAQFNASEAIIAGTNINKTGATISVVDAPTFSGAVTASSGVVFSDGTQTKEGVPSRTPIIQKTSSYTLSDLGERDDLIEIASSSAATLTIPADSTLNFPVGTSMDILQTSTGQITIAGENGVTVNATPGLKLRTQWSSATLFKRAANTWVVYGDLTA